MKPLYLVHVSTLEKQRYIDYGSEAQAREIAAYYKGKYPFAEIEVLKALPIKPPLEKRRGRTD